MTYDCLPLAWWFKSWVIISSFVRQSRIAGTCLGISSYRINRYALILAFKHIDVLLPVMIISILRNWTSCVIITILQDWIDCMNTMWIHYAKTQCIAYISTCLINAVMQHARHQIFMGNFLMWDFYSNSTPNSQCIRHHDSIPLFAKSSIAFTFFAFVWLDTWWQKTTTALIWKDGGDVLWSFRKNTHTISYIDRSLIKIKPVRNFNDDEKVALRRKIHDESPINYYSHMASLYLKPLTHHRSICHLYRIIVNFLITILSNHN